MKKPEIARRMARRGKVSSGDAADHLDRLVTEILAALRRGEPAEMPGLGSFRQMSCGRIRFDLEDKSHG